MLYNYHVWQVLEKTGLDVIYHVWQVLEETGFDIGGMIDASLYLEHRQNDQIRGLYIIPGVPMDTKFQAQTRQEIKVCRQSFFSFSHCRYLPGSVN